MEYVLLNNNVKMPKLGYGVFQVSNEECERCVLDAISVGYRAIDTAQSYGNEEAVGNAIQKCGVPREELFLTSKIWMSNASYEKAKASIDKSLHKLKTDYLDLMLIHQPFGDYYGAYRAMEEAYKEGKLRAIGVSNFYPDRLIDLCQFAEIAPMVNQVETHVFQQQRTAHEYMKKYGVQHEASNALHIVPQPEKSLREIKRVLKDDGVLIAPTFTHAENSFPGKVKAFFMNLAGFPLHSKWTSEEYLKFLQQNDWTVRKSVVLKASFPLTYTECVKSEV